MSTLSTARIAPLDENDPQSRDPLLEDLVNFLGYRPNAILTMARKSGVVPALLQLRGVTLRGKGLLIDQLKFLVAAETSRGAQCRYSTTHLVHAAHHLGVSWGKLNVLPSYLHSPLYTEQEKKAIAIATAGATLPVHGASAAIEQAKTFFSEEEIIEIVSCIAMVGWFNRWNGLMGSQLESVPMEAMDHVQWLKELTV